jgi:cell division protein FtsI (penicillin-binding protein 3)
VIKPLVAAALLEHGAHRDGRRVDCEGGRWRTHGRVIRDVKPHEHLTLPQVLAVSSNVGIVKFASALDANELHGTLGRLGLGRETGIDLPAESPGTLRPPRSWRPIDKDTAAFGYSLSATPLQLAVAYAAIANDGLRPVPRLARAFGSPDGRWHPLPTTGPTRAISPRTARTIAAWLVDVVESSDGTGRLGAVRGYRVAGKTGTAQKYVAGEGYDSSRLRATFAGFAPVENPRAVIVISVDEPTEQGTGGGRAAAPSFARVMAETLRLLRVPPSPLGTRQMAGARDGRAREAGESG